MSDMRIKLCLTLLLVCILINLISSQKAKNSKQAKFGKKPGQPNELIRKEVPFVQKFYTKTLGQIKFDRKKGRTPAKGSILECVLKCSATYGCHCIRVNKGTNECNTFVSTKDDPNSERNQTVLDQYVYFTNNGNQDESGVNLAIGKKVTQSSTYNSNKAQKAIDNNKRTESKTSGGKIKMKSTLPWIQVDLKQDHVITGVMLVTKDIESLHDFEIRVGSRQISRTDKNSHFTDNSLCFGYDGNNFLEKSKPKVVKCEPCPLMGQYITIQIVRNCTDCSNPGDNALNLAEVEVYGYTAK